MPDDDLQRQLVDAHKEIQALQHELEQGRIRYSNLENEFELKLGDKAAELKAVNQALQTEIVERRRTEQALRELEHHYELYSNNSVDIIWKMDLRLRFTFVSPSIFDMFGFTQDEWIGSSLAEHATRKEFWKMARQALGAIKNFTNFEYVVFEARMLKKNGEEFPVEIAGRVTLNQQGFPIGVHGSTRDITNRVKSQEREKRLLKQQMAVNRLALTLGETNNLQTIFTTVHQQVGELMDNYAFIISLFEEEAQLIRAAFVFNFGEQIDVSDFPPIPLGPPGTGTQSQVIRTGKPIYFPDWLQVMRKANVEYAVDEEGQVSEAPPVDGRTEQSTHSVMMVPMQVSGKVIGVLQMQSHDVDAYSQEDLDLLAGMANVAAIAIQNSRLYEAEQERRLISEALVETLERTNAELNQYAFITSHTLLEPLRQMNTFSQMLAKKYVGKLDDEADEYIQYIVKGARRMYDLINDFRDYANVGIKKLELELVDFNQVLGQVRVNLDNKIRASHAVITHDELPMVMGESSQLALLLRHLLDNAIKFRSGEPPLIHIGVQKDGEYWLFSVRDNGIGIDDSYQKRLFTIFQRLHHDDEYPGTGIGLAIARRIIERHSGKIWVESHKAKGATFYFTLPIAENSVNSIP
jgi:PAS domain S-box-containing protein